MIIHQEKVRITPSAGDGTDNIYNRGDQGRTSIRVICDYI